LKFRLLPTLLFVSLALNLFLVGVVAGGWRDLLGRSGAPAAAGVPPPVSVAGSPVPAPAPATPGSGRASATEVRAVVPGPGRAAPAAPDQPRPLPPQGPPLPPAGEGPPRGPGVSPLVRVARDLPGPERAALMSLLRSESQAVRAELHQARRDRASAWRALARGELGEDEAARRLDIARRRELSARSRVENAVADWALRQSPEIRVRVGQALAEDAQPVLRRPVRPPGSAPGWPGERPPSGPGREEES